MKGLRVLVIAVLVSALLSLVVLSVAGAQPRGSRPTVEPTITRTATETPPDAVLPTPPQEREEGPLPFTGADVSLFVIVALGAIGVGTVIVRRTRRRES